VTPDPNANGWNSGAVTATFTCADQLSGVASCPSPVTVIDDGADRSVSGTAVDNAGNTITATATVNIDTVAPVIVASISPSPNAAGWHKTPPTVHFTCTDATSGIAVCPDDVTITADGPDQSASGTAVDNAGNTTTATATVNVDTVAPVIVASISPSPNATGWYKTPQTVHFTCSDATSGIAICPGDVTTTGDGANQTVTGTAVDNAGNTTPAATIVVNVDTTNPVVAVTGAIDGGSYLQEQLPTPACATSDATSGVATPATLTTGNDGNGHYTATCTGGIDVAGNTAPPVTIAYTAVAAVRAVATNSRNTVSNNSLTAAVPTGGGVAAGDTVAVAVATGTFAGTAACTDTQNNTYTVVADRNTGNGRTFVCTAHLTHALAAADVITATYPGFSGLSLISVDAISALATNGTPDAATSGSGNSAAPAAGPVTTSTAGELLFAVIGHGSTPTLTPGPGYTAVGAFSAGTGSGRRTLTPEYMFAGPAGSYTATATLSAGQFWQAAIIAFRTP
jgi:hypothetical protein